MRQSRAVASVALAGRRGSSQCSPAGGSGALPGPKRSRERGELRESEQKRHLARVEIGALEEPERGLSTNVVQYCLIARAQLLEAALEASRAEGSLFGGLPDAVPVYADARAK